MATTMKRHLPRHGDVGAARSTVQKVCIGMGVAFIVIGLTGIIMPGALGMHLSMAHNLIHLGSGALALWAGYSDETRKAYTYCVAIGSIYGLLGVTGFLIGEPGYPGVGHMEADQNLLRVIPNVLEFGTNDHSIHLFISAVLLSSAVLWKKRNQEADRSLVDVQRRKEPVEEGGVFHSQTTRPEVPNADTDLSNADLGKSDVNRTSDMNRRADFERKL